MFKIALKTSLARKRRIVGTALSVIIGIAFLAGTFVFTDTIQRTFDNLFADVYANTDAYVRSSESIDTGFGGEQRARLPIDTVGTVAAVDGVKEAEGDVQGFARIIDKDGNALGTDNGPPTFGGSISGGDLSPWKVEAGGRLPAGPSEMAMDKGSAKKGDFSVGDQVQVVSQAGSRTFTLVGVALFGTADAPGGATFALFDLDTAADFVGRPGQVDAVLAAADQGISQQELADRIQAAFPPDAKVEVLTGAEITKENQDDIQKALSFFTIFLTIFAFIALFVAAFIIYNTFSILVAQRQRENALLRAVGASRGQVLGALLVEAVIVGIVASVIGIAGGIVMSTLLKLMLAGFGVDLPSTGLVLLPRTIVVSLIVGVLVTVISAVVPAVRASKVPPVAAMRDVDVDRSASSVGRLVAGFVVVGLGTLLTVIGLAGVGQLLGLGIPLLFIGVFVLGPLIAKPFARALGSPLPKLKGVTGTLARQNAMRNPKRTARTAAALMVGVALVAGISVLAASVRSSVRDIFGKQFVGDFVVSTNAFGFGGLSTDLARQLNDLPEVAAAAGVEIGFARQGDSDRTLSVVDPEPASQIFNFDFVAGSFADLTPEGVLLSTSRAEKDGKSVGDTIDLTFVDGVTRTLTVQGIYDKDELAGPITITKELYETVPGIDHYDFSVFVLKADGVSEAEARAAIQPVADQFPNGELQSRSEYIDSQAEQINTFVNLIYGLLFLAVLIAVFGIANTLSLSVYERTRELGLLRAVGMSQSQVRSTVRWESVITALLGAIQGIVIGIVLGYAVIVALRSQGLSKFTVPGVTLVVVLVLAFAAGVLAAILPARRASRLDVLRAIAHE